MSVRIVVAVFMLVVAVATAPAPSAARSSLGVLIVTDVVSDRPLMEGFARQLGSLLGHFNVGRIEIETVAAYASGDVGRADVTFFFSEGGSGSPAAFLGDVCRTRKTVVWLGSGLERLGVACDVAARTGVAVIGRTSAKTVRYKDAVLDKGDVQTSVVQVVDPRQTDVLAWAEMGARRVPYIVHTRDFWFVADNPLSGADVSDRYLAFADVLHEVLREDHPPSRSAMIRIEDVNPLSDPAALRAIADRLYRARVPFVVGVVPFYVDPDQRLRIRLGDEPDVVAALQYMTTRGGSLAVHGATHQYQGVSTVDFEFWDAAEDAPIDGETEQAVRGKIEAALDELFRNRLYPLLWETPHYAGSQLTYHVVAQYFSTAMEQRLTMDDSRTSFFVPYVIHRDVHGQQIIPENLGYVPLERPTIDHLMRAARANLVVRDGFASAFFHPFVPLGVLDDLVRGVKGLGYTYVDVRRFAHAVHAGDKAVITGHGAITVKPAGRFLREYRFNAAGMLVEEDGTSDPISGSFVRRVRLPEDWVYVIEATDTPLPPFWIRKPTQALDALVRPFTLTSQFRAARRAGSEIGPIHWLALAVSLAVVSLATVGAMTLAALRVNHAVMLRRWRAR